MRDDIFKRAPCSQMPCVWLMLLRRAGVLATSRARLRLTRARWDLQGLVDCHHVIPRCCAEHPTVRALGFDVHNSDANFAFVPTRAGARVLRLRPDRVVHHAGHLRYNAYVRARLDEVDSRAEFVSLLARLHRHARYADPDVPWN